MTVIAAGENTSRRKRYFSGWRRDDQEFLPAALEILETPPSPIQMALLSAICLFVVVALTWSYVSRIDIIAVAQGKLQPTGRVKVIQPLETSRVRAINVENGHEVRSGDILVEFDKSEAAAEQAAAQADLASYIAEVLRRQSAIGTADTRHPSAVLKIKWPDTVPESIRQREQRVFESDVSQLNGKVASYDAQLLQKEAERQRLTTMISSEKDLIATLDERVKMRLTLLGLNAGSKSNLLDAVQVLQGQKTTLAEQIGQLAEVDAALVVLSKEIDNAFGNFIAENAQKLAEAERKTSELAEQLNKTTAKLEHLTLRSPIDGMVQASTLTTVGQVVTTSQELMRIVPQGAALEVECYLPNRDIGFVKKGDRAILKIESFPFTRYGTIEAEVVRVATDAFPEPEAEQRERDTLRDYQSLSREGAQRTQNLVFPVTLRPSQTFVDVDGTKVPLGAGMAVTAEIRTGNRRVLEYVFSPLVKVGSEALKER